MWREKSCHINIKHIAQLIFKSLSPIWQILVLSAAKRELDSKGKFEYEDVKVTLRNTLSIGDVSICTMKFEDGRTCNHFAVHQYLTEHIDKIHPGTKPSRAIGKIIPILVLRAKGERNGRNVAMLTEQLPPKNKATIADCLQWNIKVLEKSHQR
jgi:hypothetical protein